MTKPHYLALLAGLFMLAMAISGLNASQFDTWLLENAITALVVGGLYWQYRDKPLSTLSYTLIFIFGMFHCIGARYTYSLVPYNEWSQALVGISINELFGWERNHYDRLVHFIYGFLLVVPVREIYMHYANSRGGWSYWLPLEMIMATSMIYELIEWGAAELFGGELGMAYLGTQGDVWDAHKDMALATLGAAVTLSVIAYARREHAPLTKHYDLPPLDPAFSNVTSMSVKRLSRLTAAKRATASE